MTPGPGCHPGPGFARAAALILLLSAPISAAASADPALNAFEAGRAAFAAGRPVEASNSFRRVVMDYPRSAFAPEAGYLLGAALFSAGQWQETITALTSFNTRYPGSALAGRASYWLGAASVELGRYEQALGFLTGSQAMVTQPGPFAASTRLLTGIALEGLGRADEAAAQYGGILGDAGTAAVAAEARFRLAGLEMRAGRFDTARDLYEHIVLDSTDSPWVPDSLYFLAECELALGSPSDAVRRYRTLLAVYPGSPWREQATFRMAFATWRAGDGQSASAMADLYLQQYPAGTLRGSVALLKADIARESGDFELAAATYAAAVPLAASETERRRAWYAQGVSLIGAGRLAEAAQAFGLAAAEPGDAAAPPGGETQDDALAEAAAFQQAVLLLKTGARPDAIGALRSAVRDHPDAANTDEMLRLLAALLQQSGDNEGAVARWNEVLGRFPGSPGLPEALFRRGAGLAAVGRTAAAMDDYQRVIAEFPTSEWKTESQYALGYLYVLQGEYPRAVPWFRAAAGQSGDLQASGGPAGGAGHDMAVRDRAALAAGISLFDMGSFASALAAMDAILVNGSAVASRGTVELYAGRSLYRLEKLDAAADRFAEAGRLLGGQDTPEAADAAWWLGWSALRLGRIVDARDAFLAVAREHPADPRAAEALYRAGVAETVRYDDAAAVKLLDQVIAEGTAASTVREQALYEKGWALLRLKLTGESAAAFSELATDYPGGRLAPTAWFRLAQASMDAQRYGQAAAGFKSVAVTFPDSSLALPALYWSAEALRRGGDARGALDAYWSCLAAGPGAGLRDAALDGFHAAMRTAGSLDAARQFADRARASAAFPAEAAAGVLLACAEQILPSSPEDALALIAMVRAGNPAEPRAGEAALLAAAYQARTGNWLRALGLFSTLAASRTDEVGARAAREQGLALEALGRTAEAVDVLLSIQARFPGFQDIIVQTLGDAERIAFAKGDRQKADEIDKALRAASSGPERGPGSPAVQAGPEDQPP